MTQSRSRYIPPRGHTPDGDWTVEDRESYDLKLVRRIEALLDAENVFDECESVGVCIDEAVPDAIDEIVNENGGYIELALEAGELTDEACFKRAVRVVLDTFNMHRQNMAHSQRYIETLSRKEFPND